ncbi:hypothetical protein [Compostibacter hankyongensis]|uniref:Tetratricopeptide repeat protein n=1 Tax=Compostibacter hankyongensis TaxID=1007089 RepID=A0ABP8GAX9_9BACT
MHTANRILPVFLTCLLLLICRSLSAQIVLKHEQKIPDSVYENMPAPSEKLAQKPFSFNRKIYQNLVTRDNYYFNAREKLKHILERVQAAHPEAYDTLLPFYALSPDDFSQAVPDLDSVILKSSIGINIHDPRDKWMDDLYLLVGKAYYYKADYENALIAFQFINKAFAPAQEKNAPPLIGTRGYTSRPQISVATPEKKGFLHHTPARNAGLLWLIRTYISGGQYDRARALLSSLQVDPLFPERLRGALAEQQAYFYYAQGDYPHCLPALLSAIDAGPDKAVGSRWAFLAGQLYERQQAPDKAIEQYRQVIDHHPDPLLNFYARLNIIRINIATGREDFDTGTRTLLAMARKEKYARYRSILYYALAELALGARQPAAALEYLHTGLRYNRDNTAQQVRLFKLLGDTYYALPDYGQAYNYYDSTASVMTAGMPFAGMVNQRRQTLGAVVEKLRIIRRQDSLRALADLPPAELQARLQRIVDDSLRIREKKARRDEQRRGGDKDAGGLLTAGGLAGNDGLTANGKQQGDWYFYNAALKGAGFNLFRSRWGKRPEGDNWRLSNAAAAAIPTDSGAMETAAGGPGAAGQPFSLETLMAPLPTTPEKRKQSDDSLINAYYALGGLYADELENIPGAIHSFDTLLIRFPANSYKPQALYRLYLLYSKAGQTARAEHYKSQLLAQFPDDKYTAFLRPRPDSTAAEAAATALYEKAYADYLSGNYASVLQQQSLGDSLYPHNPQKGRFDLLRAMTLVKQQSDSAGRAALNDVLRDHAADSALSTRARDILAALDHKDSLIAYLQQLQLAPEEEPGNYAVNTTAPTPASQKITAADSSLAIAKDSAAAPVAVQPPPPAAGDSLRTPAPAVVVTPYKAEADMPYFVILTFLKTNKTLVENGLAAFAKYNRQQHPGDSIEVSPYVIIQNRVMLIFRPFENEAAAKAYYNELRARTSRSIFPAAGPRDYFLCFISRDNFVLLNNTKDLNGYLQFFVDRYLRPAEVKGER